MSRIRQGVASLMMLVGATVGIAAHVGMFDHVDHVMTPMAADVAPNAMTTNRIESMTETTASISNMSMPMGGHGISAMMTICDLFVLVSIVGLGLHRFFLALRQRPSRPRALQANQLRWHSRTLRPLRPPGLTLLCVVRC